MKLLIGLSLLFYVCISFAEVRIQCYQREAWIYIYDRPFVVRPGDLNVISFSRVRLISKYHTNSGFIYYFSCQTNSGEVFFELLAETGVVSIGAQHRERSKAVFLYDLPRVYDSWRGGY